MKENIICSGALFYSTGTKRFLFLQRTDIKTRGSWGLVGGQAKFIINNSGQVGIGNTDPGFKLDVSGNVRFTGTLQIDGNSVKLHNTAARIKYGLWNNNDVYGIGMINGVTGGGINNDYAMTFQMNNQGARGFWFGDSSHTLAQHAMTITTQGKVNIASGLKVGYGESDTEVAGSSGINVKGDSTFVNDVAVTQNLTVNGTFGTNEGHTIDIIRDENDMASNDETALATQQSIKAYVDTEVGGIQSATFVYDNGTLTITTT